ncbi:hypothetical protein [Eoetvoesiella caeni]
MNSTNNLDRASAQNTAGVSPATPKTHQPADVNNNGEWLEDSRSGRFTRVTTTPEESTWLCNECGEPDADPHENGCLVCGAEAEIY